KAQMETFLPPCDRIVLLAGQRYREFLMEYLRQRTTIPFSCCEREIMTVCKALHKWANYQTVLRFPFDDSAIPLNGIYILFEQGEIAHGGNRIVRVGTHTGPNQLRSRLRQHFPVENKDRSIFRKNIGRALLNRQHDPFLQFWELDRTSRLAKAAHVI